MDDEELIKTDYSLQNIKNWPHDVKGEVQKRRREKTPITNQIKD